MADRAQTVVYRFEGSGAWSTAKASLAGGCLGAIASAGTTPAVGIVVFAVATAVLAVLLRAVVAVATDEDGTYRVRLPVDNLERNRRLAGVAADGGERE